MQRCKFDHTVIVKTRPPSAVAVAVVVVVVAVAVAVAVAAVGRLFPMVLIDGQICHPYSVSNNNDNNNSNNSNNNSKNYYSNSRNYHNNSNK